MESTQLDLVSYSGTIMLDQRRTSLSSGKMTAPDPAEGIKAWHYAGKHPKKHLRREAKNRLADWMANQMDDIMFKTLSGESANVHKH